jgi:hypothetical protein
MVQFIHNAALILTPFIALWLTFWWQNRKEKRDAKRQLFLALMAHRKSVPPTYEWVRALNIIDLVFSDDAGVIKLWHELYQLLTNPSTPESQSHKSLEMLSEMARVLGYKKLSQVNIDQFFCPQAHTDQLKMTADIQAELLRILKETGRFSTEPKKDE